MRAFASLKACTSWKPIHSLIVAALALGLSATACGDESISTDGPAPASASPQPMEDEEDEYDDREDDYSDEDEEEEEEGYSDEDSYSKDEPYMKRYGKDNLDGYGHNPACGDMNDEWVECKIDPVSEYYYTTYSGDKFADYSDMSAEEKYVCDALNFHVKRDGKEFDWKTDGTHVNAICVKGGPGANCYFYGKYGATEGEDLNAYDLDAGKYYGLSHITVCTEPQPDVSVEKEAIKDKVSLGDYAAFKLTVENEGTAKAKDVTLDDVLPDHGYDKTVNWKLKSLEVNGYSIDPSKKCEITDPYDYKPDDILECNFDYLKPGDKVVVKVARKTTKKDCGKLYNTATVSADNEPYGDRYQKNNESSDAVKVKCAADVKVEKTAVTSPINLGEKAIFKLKVSNVGHATAKYVKLIDALPGTGWYVHGDNAYACKTYEHYGKTKLVCNFGDLAPYASKKVYVARKTNEYDCGWLENKATVSAYNDADHSNNYDDAKVKVQCVADLRLNKFVNSETVELGEQIRFNMSVKNNGPATATNVKLFDKLPGTGWNLGGADKEHCSTTEYDGDTYLKCVFPEIVPDDNAIVAAFKTATEELCGQTLDNTAKVYSKNDPDFSNNVDSASITVDCGDVGGEMCTADYWKNNPDQWCDDAKYKTLGDIFYLEGYKYKLGDKTLYEALSFSHDDTKLGAVKFLLRQAVAAYLSACSDSVDYPLSKHDIVMDVWWVLYVDYKSDILELAYKLEYKNKAAECPGGYSHDY